MHAETEKTERMKLRANFAHTAVEMSQLSFKVVCSCSTFDARAHFKDVPLRNVYEI